MNLKQLLDFKPLGDARGQLFSIEGNQNIPFDIKRVYYMFGMDSALPRGFHAHKELQQVAICMKGNCKMLLDNGKVKEEITLDRSDFGVVIDELIWHEMHDFSDDCILMVIASDYYDEDDYIRDYDEFLKTVNENKLHEKNNSRKI
jgi:dTDP-4-dehydrorhamnose 3,5-epimerase-like enzyme